MKNVIQVFFDISAQMRDLDREAYRKALEEVTQEFDPENFADEDARQLYIHHQLVLGRMGK